MIRNISKDVTCYFYMIFFGASHCINFTINQLMLSVQTEADQASEATEEGWSEILLRPRLSTILQPDLFCRACRSATISAKL
jgi:hypothetical protein